MPSLTMSKAMGSCFRISHVYIIIKNHFFQIVKVKLLFSSDFEFIYDTD